MYCDVEKVEPREDYLLALTFADGCRKLFDMKPYLGLGMFRDLRSIVLFNTVRVSYGSVEWANKADFDPEALYDLGMPLAD